MKGWKKIFHANGKGIKARVAVLTSDKIDFKVNAIVRNKEGHCNDKGRNPNIGYNPCKYMCHTAILKIALSTLL